MAMRLDLLKKYDLRVPRYTSYPTAPMFHGGITSDDYAAWLAEIPEDMPLSLYAHVPFCDTLCWFCGCATKIVNRYDPVAKFLPHLLSEIDLVADALGVKRSVSHMHWGGGSPTMLTAEHVRSLGAKFHEKFTLLDGAEFAVEIDPRELPFETIQALADIGVNRASIGLQDVNEKVQIAINRVQSMQETKACIDGLRSVGINQINIDLIYGLPYQTVDNVLTSVEAALSFDPGRVVLFGYAHVPGMKKHQRLIPDDALPDAGTRAKQAASAAAALINAGYIEIGLDHFARPNDPMAIAFKAGQLHRNFQGYTVDESSALIGFGPSAIGTLPNAYIQNTPAIHEYSRAVTAGKFAIHKGIAMSEDDIIHRTIIERLMCDNRVDLQAIGRRYTKEMDYFDSELVGLKPFIEDGLVIYENNTVSMTHEGEPLVRCVAALFDQYFRIGEEKYSKAI
mgnify:CR=1 FL=1|jgi:oxygen-independent coproporphyrinogen III oxidase